MHHLFLQSFVDVIRTDVGLSYYVIIQDLHLLVKFDLKFFSTFFNGLLYDDKDFAFGSIFSFKFDF